MFVACRIPDGKPPRFPKKPTIRQEGDILIMECILEAHPVPEITWYQGTKAINGSTRIKMLRKSTGKDTYLLTLEISNPTKADGGQYRCNAFNNFGESNANISLNFQGKLDRLLNGVLLPKRIFLFLNLYDYLLPLFCEICMIYATALCDMNIFRRVHVIRLV